MASERLNSRMLKLVRRKKKVIRIAKSYLEQKEKQECYRTVSRACHIIIIIKGDRKKAVYLLIPFLKNFLSGKGRIRIKKKDSMPHLKHKVVRKQHKVISNEVKFAS